MRIQNTVPEACPVCGKETTLDVTEPHPTHPEIELRTYRRADCGPVKTTSVRVRPSRSERPSSLRNWGIRPKTPDQSRTPPR